MRGIDVFCERCGARQPTERRDRAPSSGSFARRLASAVGRTADGVAEPQPEMFLRLCLECRGYSCPACWNETESRCQTCAPAPVTESSLALTEALAPIALPIPTEQTLPAEPPPPPPPPPMVDPLVMPIAEFIAAADLEESPALEEPAALTEVLPAEESAIEQLPVEAAPVEAAPVEVAPIIDPPARPVAPPPVKVHPVDPMPYQEPTPEPTPSPEITPTPTHPPLAIPVPPPQQQPEPASLPLAASATPAVPQWQPDPVMPAPTIPPRVRPSISFDSTAEVPAPAFTAAMAAAIAAQAQQPAPAAQPLAPREYLPVPQLASATPAPPGVKPCRSCQLPLSAKAHFCRRCGSAQES